ncbi:MAG: PEP-CTERM sorting domain-containing protein [Rhodocyclaceae bacterium]|nr:PEP-CTERM sorting domain-containing protein [Rhodocyclaceae bacterium]MBX3669368.1 PEP-CTERM sorting domain-containing protein [Rhodocyclaceae bacterium]
MLICSILTLIGTTGALDARAATSFIPIQSGPDWLATNNVSGDPNWKQTSYDDSGWVAAYAPYPNSLTTPQDIFPRTSAQLMWHWNPSSPDTPDGTNGGSRAYFRYGFTIAPDAGDLLYGRARVVADDSFVLYVNGTQVGNGLLSSQQRTLPDGNGVRQPLPVSFDISPYLQPGNNVLALAAQNFLAGGPNPQYAFFDGWIANSPALPAFDNLRERDLRQRGDSLVTLDRVTDRKWLDLSQTAGLSYNDMIGPANNCNPTCTTGQYSGWTMASLDDVRQLFDDAGLPGFSEYRSGDTCGSIHCRNNLAIFLSLVGAFGDFRLLGPQYQPDQFFGDLLELVDGISRSLVPSDSPLWEMFQIPPEDAVFVPGAGVVDCCDYQWTYDARNGPLALAAGDPAVGVWLYRAPEPGMISLIALAALFGLRRRRRA